MLRLQTGIFPSVSLFLGFDYYFLATQIAVDVDPLCFDTPDCGSVS